MQYMHKINAAQRSMEHSMLGASLVDRVPVVEIRRKTKVDDTVTYNKVTVELGGTFA